MTELEKTIGYTFRNPTLLQTAMTHTSYSNENTGMPSNERLEFLGDSVLGFLTASDLYEANSMYSEGDLTRLRAAYVCESSLARAAESIGVDRALMVGRGEQNEGGRHRPSLLADAFEALIAAIYLDGGMTPVQSFVRGFLLSKGIPAENTDYKTALQELTQRDGGSPPVYCLSGESGPDHSKTFEVEVAVDGRVLGRGSGRSKKAAEQEAARRAMEVLSGRAGT